MKYLLRLAILSLAFLSVAVEAGALQCRQEAVSISAVPVKNIDQLLEEYQPLAELLSEGLDMPVRILRSSSYEGVIDAIVSGGADIALLGPASYLMAYRRNSGIEAFASMALEGGHFSPAGDYYHSILVVRSDSGLRQPEDTRGRRVALADPASTSGALVPNREFAARVATPLHEYFSGQVYAGSHDKALESLLQGRVDAAFVSSVRADDYLRRGLIGTDTLRVLWRSTPLHYDPFVFSSDICSHLKTKIRALMLEPSPNMEAFLHSQRTTRIIPVSHQAYQPLLQLMAPR